MLRFKRFCSLLLMCIAGVSSGCGSRMVAMNNPIAITEDEYDRVFEAGIDVLRLEQFHVNRQDRRHGVITTEPRVAASIMEPWWTDNTTAYQHLDASLNYQRRLVRVYLEPADPDALAAAHLARVDVRRGDAPTDMTTDQAGEVMALGNPDEDVAIEPMTTSGLRDYQLRVEVMLEQRQIPEHQLHTAAMGSPTNYGRLADVRTTVTERGAEQSFWRPVGRDVYYEQRLIREILNRSTFITPRFKSPDGPIGDDDPITPELIRPNSDDPVAQPNPRETDQP